jgi:hypothetical protein
MIIWINGAFGVGKSTAAELVRDLLPDARLFDPEYVGYLLVQFVEAPTGDFQDLPLWRRLTVATLGGLAEEYGGAWVVPMTLVNKAYRDEIHDGLRAQGLTVRHFVLTAPEPVLRARIEADQSLAEDAREWRRQHVEPSLTGLAGLSREEPDTEEIDASAAPEEIAKLIVDRCAPPIRSVP